MTTENKELPALRVAAAAGLVAVARAAWVLCDNTENAGEPDMVVDPEDWQKLSDALDELDKLPDDQPGCIMEGPAKAEWALRGTGELTYAPELAEQEQERAIRLLCKSYEAGDSNQTMLAMLRQNGFQISAAPPKEKTDGQ